MGAWIETHNLNGFGGVVRSHPTWVRGLKPSGETLVMNKRLSHPTWVRGLKLHLII